jgi:hypothetical protein
MYVPDSAHDLLLTPFQGHLCISPQLHHWARYHQSIHHNLLPSDLHLASIPSHQPDCGAAGRIILHSLPLWTDAGLRTS